MPPSVERKILPESPTATPMASLKAASRSEPETATLLQVIAEIVAELLVAEPAEFITTTSYLAESVTPANSSDVPVAPPITEPLLRHWYDNGPEPLAVTVRIALEPDATVCDCG